MFFSIALYIGDGGYQVVRMLVMSVQHFMAVRRARAAGTEVQLKAGAEDGGDILGAPSFSVRRIDPHAVSLSVADFAVPAAAQLLPSG